MSMTVIVINAGHTKMGKGTGASKYLTESVETRKIAYELMVLLADTKHEVIPAVFDSSTTNLNDAVKLANDKKADIFISIHLNAGGGTGVECFTWKGQMTDIGKAIQNNIVALGFKNRGIKDGSQFYVIKNTHAKCEATLVECCFVDNKNDVAKYNYKNMAKAIYNAICSVYGK